MSFLAISERNKHFFNLHPHLLSHQLTDIFFSFQQTPAFWEEEEVSDHLFFPLSLSLPPMLPFSSVLLPWSVLRDSSRTHQILACRSAAFPGVFFFPRPRRLCLPHLPECARRTERDGHYSSGLPKSIIIKANTPGSLRRPSVASGIMAPLA